MKNRTKLLFAGAAALGAWGAYEYVVKPRMFSWGATPEECSRTWPGDEFTPHTSGICTRAVTVHATPEEIWPWILQTGQDRAGFYSYTWLENLFRAKMQNTFDLVPAWQERHVGDDLWLAYKNNYGGLARMTIARLEPFRAMVTVAHDDRASALNAQWAPHGCWNFLLDPVDEKNTRLIMRSILPEHPTLWGRASRVFFDPAHFIMERKMMLNIKRLAEQAKGSAEQGKSLAEQGKSLAEQGKSLAEQEKRLAEQGKSPVVEISAPSAGALAECAEPFTTDVSAQTFDATAT
jgi:hypothetical protein